MVVSGDVLEIETMIPSRIVSVRDLTGRLEIPSMRLPQKTVVCRVTSASLSSVKLAEATVIVNIRNDNELRVFDTTREVAKR